MPVVTRGFGGRRGRADRQLPPGQYETRDFPILSAGPTPQIAPDRWQFTITTETGQQHAWSWPQFMALPQQAPTVDIHCVTKWSKFGTSWRGVAIDTLLEGITTSAEFVMAHSYGGYTTNLPLADLREGKAWIVHEYDGRPLPAEHGGPARLLVPHLYFWKSAKWVNGL
ncbi:MAG: molybdopterin-dependent oxidoreductase, partial [Mycobacterium sp.]|nr:molybdopterin-dependent oxidoreductase [Mycobacterium sp.]